MSGFEETLSVTTSLCPACLRRVPGTYVAGEDGVYLDRSCPDHGPARRKVWGSRDHWEWARDYGPDPGPTHDDRETGDGSDLVVDNDHACLAVIEVTRGCNLSCSYCFASSGPRGRDLDYEEVVDLLEVVRSGGGPRPIQFSGGEPTIRRDLPELVEVAVDRGFKHIEVNTNGIVMAREDGYAERLVEAGVTAIYLQFDGLEPATYESIRDVDLVETKLGAVEACRRAGLPVILVPTVVPEVNTHEMGGIVRFALANLDVVRAVNFQPVAHFGRYADDGGRFSLDRAAGHLSDQLEPMAVRDFLPVPCCSSYCQLATAVMPDGDGGLVPLTQYLAPELWETVSGLVDEADWMELLAGTALGENRSRIVAGCCGFQLPGESGCCGPATVEGPERGGDAVTGGGDLGSLPAGLLDRVLPVTITGFMDADAADVDRLSNCCIAVPTPSGELVPFCGYNMTTDGGRYALRERYRWGGRSVVDGGEGPPESIPHGPIAGLDREDPESIVDAVEE